VRVWGLEGCGGSDGSNDGEGNEGGPGDGRLLWTGWGHASRVWDVGFTKIGVVSCGEVRQPAEAFAESRRNCFFFVGYEKNSTHYGPRFRPSVRLTRRGQVMSLLFGFALYCFLLNGFLRARRVSFALSLLYFLC